MFRLAVLLLTWIRTSAAFCASEASPVFSQDFHKTRDVVLGPSLSIPLDGSIAETAWGQASASSAIAHD